MSAEGERASDPATSAHLRARRALLALDRDALDASLRALAAAPDDASTRHLRGWAAAVEGLLARRSDVAEVQRAERDAARARDPLVTVELAALGALAALAGDDLATARGLARRACRMARVESLGEGEVLAHLALSRVRRAMGHPHLASRICHGVAPLARTSAWLDWERAMSADAVVGSPISAMVAAASAGDRAAFERAAAAAPRLPWVEDDHAAVAAALDPSRPAPDAIADWLRGEGDRPPSALAGVRLAGRVDEHATVYVVCRPTSRRRVLACALRARRARGATLQGRAEAGRVDSLVAALALVPPDGADQADVFRGMQQRTSPDPPRRVRRRAAPRASSSRTWRAVDDGAVLRLST